jgi:putative tryptophan/tyrosine transport system substrate-binding protein
MITRRELLLVLGAGALATHVNVAAQPAGRIYRIGYLGVAPRPPDDDFRAGLRDLGYVEGKNLNIEYRWGGSDVEAFAKHAKDFVASKVDVIVTIGSPPTLAAKEATRTIPIVLVDVANPVLAGFVASLQRPGANLTGVSAGATELSQKSLQLLKEIVPGLTQVAIPVNLANPSSPRTQKDIETAALKMNLKPDFFYFKTAKELQEQLAILARKRPQAMVMRADHFIYTQRDQFFAFVNQHRIPAAYGLREYALEGGLLAMGPDRQEIFRRAAVLVDKIFKGAKPADIPVEQPTKFELVINMKTAKALGIQIPPSVLVRADKVIE